jgi:hypothetical protein
MMKNDPAAKNLPSTTCASVSGAVNNNSIVPRFFSSENSPIVSIGMMNSRITLSVLRKPRLIMPGMSMGRGPNCCACICDIKPICIT